MSLEVLSASLDALRNDRPAALCRLIATRGSTPQKAGAMMLVNASNEQVGTLGGGCVEADVKRRALEAIKSGEFRLERFELDHDFSWDDGLICGGRMDVVIAPLLAVNTNRNSTIEFLTTLRDLVRGHDAFCEAFVLDSEATNLPENSWIVLDHNYEIKAKDNAPLSVVPNSLKLLLDECTATRRPATKGGFAVIPSTARCRLLIVGAGHVGQAVASLAANLDFDVWVVDDRESMVSETRFPHAEKRIAGDIESTLREIEITSNTYCLIVTRGHGHDEKALYYLANQGARYVGMIGSRRKIKLIFEDLLAEGVTSESLAQVYAPVGIEIGSQTVPEIAVSIAAELIAHRNLSGEVPGRPERVRIPK